jgi:hypothetical protein
VHSEIKDALNYAWKAATYKKNVLIFYAPPPFFFLLARFHAWCICSLDPELAQQLSH